MVKIIVSTFAHSHAVELEQMLDSCASQQYDVTYYIHLHSMQPDVVAMCDWLSQRPNVRLFPHGVNRGLAKSFNDTLLMAHAEAAQLVINSNDDSLWSAGDLDRLITKALDNPHAGTVSCLGSHAGRPIDSMGYCAIAFNWIAFDRVGLFDENFFPAYHEDVDHARRCNLAGLEALTCEETFVQHAGSGTIAKNRTLHDQIMYVFFGLNQAYYTRKWGGKIGSETYTQPFNQFPLFIDPAKRGGAYPGFDRTDQEIVKV
jgi:GT2 family glycosyltransferase